MDRVGGSTQFQGFGRGFQWLARLAVAALLAVASIGASSEMGSAVETW